MGKLHSLLRTQAGCTDVETLASDYWELTKEWTSILLHLMKSNQTHITKFTLMCTLICLKFGRYFGWGSPLSIQKFFLFFVSLLTVKEHSHGTNSYLPVYTKESPTMLNPLPENINLKRYFILHPCSCKRDLAIKEIVASRRRQRLC